MLAAGEGPAFARGGNVQAAGVAAEEGPMAAFGDPGLQVVGHRGAPVFIVADAEDEFVAGEQLGAEFEVVIAGELKRVAVLLRPHDEGQLPARELLRAGPLKAHAAALGLR